MKVTARSFPQSIPIVALKQIPFQRRRRSPIAFPRANAGRDRPVTGLSGTGQDG